MKDYYKAETFSKDFTDPATVDFVNDWCNQHTEGMIKKIVSGFNPNTKLMLMNAIYFKAAWAGKFDKNNTKDEFFTMADGNEVKVKMMKRCNGTLYGKNDVFSTIGLPYGKGDKWCMYVLLPNEGQTIENIFSHFVKEGWESTRSKMEGKLVNVELPKFKTESEIDLNDICVALGATSLFNPATADLTLMTQNKTQLWVDLIIQKAAIEVSEEGTEASAVTYDMITSFSGGQREGKPIDQFIANRPFLYIIQEASSGAIFFIGTFQGN
jgi:serpin B